MISLVDIQRAGPSGRARVLHFDDGTQRQTSAAVVRALGLETGPVEDLGELLAALDLAEPVHARKRALRLLEHRERSCHELSKRIREDGYAREVADEVVVALERMDLVDDIRFAETWARSRILAGYGPHRVLREMTEKGVDSELSRRALADALAGDDELTCARRLVTGTTLDNDRGRERALRRLLRRGFSPEVALRAVEHETAAQPARSPTEDA